MYDPNVCTPTMFEDELRAMSTMSAFSDPALDSRLAAVAELRRAIQAVREIPGWSGDSVGSAETLLQRMEKNATTIETALNDLRTSMRTAADTAAGAASSALRRLPSASAEGFLADAGRNLSGITDGWGALDTGEAVAREEARLAAERETAAMNELRTIRSTLTSEANESFTVMPARENVDTTSVPLPVIDVEGIDSRVPAVGSNGPSSYPQGGPGGGSWTPPPSGTWVPDGNGGGGGGGGGSIGGGGNDNGGNGGGNGNGGDGGNGGNGGNGGDGGDGGNGGNGTGSDPSVDSPGGGTLPGYPDGLPGGGSGGGGGLLAGGGGGGTLGAAVVGGAGGAALLGARAASLNSAGGAGLFGGGAGGIGGSGAATAGRGLLGMTGATGPGGFGAAGAGASGAGGAGSAGGSTTAAGGRTMAPGMMGGAGDDEKRERSGLGGPIAPKLDDDEETGPRSRSAQAGSRETHD